MLDHDFQELTIYLDESGSTGSNYLDKDQPYYVQAGFVVQKQNEQKVVEAYKKWESKNLKSKQKEIKGSSFLKTSKGLSKFETLLNEVSPYIMGPTFAVLDKKYGLCAATVEAFLDSYYNPAVTTNEFHWENNKIRWAELLYKHLSEKTLNIVNRIVLNREMDLAKEAQLLIAKDLEKSNHNDLAKKVKECPISEAFSFLSQKVGISPNSMCFNAHLFCVKNELVKLPPKQCNIYYDEQKQFGQLFTQYLKIIQAGPLQEIPIGDGKYALWGELGNWSIGFIPSHNNELIRLADIFSAYLKICLLSLNETAKIPGKSQRIYNSFWSPIIRGLYPDKLKGFPEWYYYGVPSDMMIKIIKGLKKE